MKKEIGKFARFPKRKKGAYWLKIVVLLLVTAMPGLHKLAPQILFKIVNPPHLDGYTTDNFIVFIFSFFTCFSWGNLFLSDVEQFESFACLIKFLIYGLLTTLVCAPFIYILHEFGFVSDVFSTIVLLAGWSTMQLARHYLLAREKRNLLLCVDLLFLIVYMAVIFLARNGESSLINIYQGICCAAVTALLLSLLRRNASTSALELSRISIRDGFTAFCKSRSVCGSGI